MTFVLQRKTNEDKSTEIFPPLLCKPPYIHACDMTKAKKGQQKVPILKKTTVSWPSRSY